MDVDQLTTRMDRDPDKMDLGELIELAKKRGLIDSAERVGAHYHITIGRGHFEFGHDGTRKFLIRLLGDFSGDRK